MFVISYYFTIFYYKIFLWEGEKGVGGWGGGGGNDVNFFSTYNFVCLLLLFLFIFLLFCFVHFELSDLCRFSKEAHIVSCSYF